MVSIKRKTGDVGERLAKEFLIEAGYKILDQNYRIKNLGEIDIVAEKDRKITFFEVKTRGVRHETSFPIEFSINEKKRRNLKKVCELYLLANRYDKNRDWRVDALFVRVSEEGKPSISHLENILWEEYY